VIARNNVNLTQGALAEKGGFSARSVAAWEGNESEPSMENVVRLSGVLGVSASWLLTGQHETAAALRDAPAVFDAPMLLTMFSESTLKAMVADLSRANYDADKNEAAIDFLSAVVAELRRRVPQRSDRPRSSSRADDAAAAAAEVAAAEARKHPPSQKP